MPAAHTQQKPVDPSDPRANDSLFITLRACLLESFVEQRVLYSYKSLLISD